MPRISIDDAIDEYIYWFYTLFVKMLTIFAENIQNIKQISDTLLTQVK